MARQQSDKVIVFGIVSRCMGFYPTKTRRTQIFLAYGIFLATDERK